MTQRVRARGTAGAAASARAVRDDAHLSHHIAYECDTRCVGRIAALVDRLLARAVAAGAGAGAASAAGGLPRLDLHGLGVRAALAATERFLIESQAAGIREVRIVYGKGRHSPGGRGVLREVVPRWLAVEGGRWVEQADPEPDARGEDAAIVVRLRARTPDVLVRPEDR